MKLALLGSPELTDGGKRIDLSSRRQRQFLEVLGLHAGRVISADAISELVWGSDQPVDPAAAVQTNISRIRRLLQPPLSVESVAGGYVFNCPDDSLDVSRFEMLTEEMKTADPATQVRIATSALALWRGRPYGELDHLDVEGERQRLIEMKNEITESLGQNLVDLGRHREAIVLMESHTRSNPYREKPVATLMRALYAENRQADALSAYTSLRTRLVEDLGVDPSTELRDLEMAILKQSLPGGRTSGKLEQRIRFCTATDGTRLAYALSGVGPPLVKAATWMSHLDHDWDSLVWRHWNEGLSANHTLVRYDERGCGLSDWRVERFEFDAWVEDLATVVDELKLERFPLIGISQGGAVAIEYATRYPDRVSKLVLYGSYPRGRMVRATSEAERNEAALNLELARLGWGKDSPAFRHVFTRQFMPEGTLEEWNAFDELQRRTCSPENAVRFLEVFGNIDVTEAARRVECPTLIIHSRDEVRVPFSNAVELASLIPDSRLVPLESTNHILTGRDHAWPRFLEVVREFLS